MVCLKTCRLRKRLRRCSTCQEKKGGIECNDRTSMASPQLEPVCHILTPVGNLGYGFDNNELNGVLRSLAGSRAPTAIILNSKLENLAAAASGELSAGLLASYQRDVRKLLRHVGSHGVPLILNSVEDRRVGCHLNTLEDIIRETAADSAQSLSVVKVAEEELQPKIEPSDRGPSRVPKVESTPSPSRESQPLRRTISNGVRSFMAAAESHPGYNILLCASDYSILPFLAFTSACLKQKQNSLVPDSTSRMKGGIMHMSKILEAGGVCATPKCAGAVGTLYSDGSFDVRPTSMRSQCTSLSMAAYTLQTGVKTFIPELGGRLDLSQTCYGQLEDTRTVRVRRSMLVHANAPSREATLERPYRGIFLGTISDPTLIPQIDFTLELIKGYVQAQRKSDENDNHWTMSFDVYGRSTNPPPSEVIIAGEVKASTHEIARSIAEIARMATKLSFGIDNRGVEFPEGQVNVSMVS